METQPERSSESHDEDTGDKTTSLDTPQPPVLQDDEALARALAARGVPPEEIQRLLSLGRSSGATPATTAGVADTPPQCPIPGPVFQPHPTITFPEFRDSTAEEADKADKVLRQAALHKRRGRFADAAKECEEAIRLIPKDAAALELYGDILQSLGRVDDALAAYRRAGEADPRRASAEKKYAELLLMQDRSVSAFQGPTEVRNPYVAVLLSALCPGAGQYYNGQPVKALTLAFLALGFVALLFWTPLGFATAEIGLSATSVVLIVLLGALYIYALVDANLVARMPVRRKGGWDV